MLTLNIILTVIADLCLILGSAVMIVTALDKLTFVEMFFIAQRLHDLLSKEIVSSKIVLFRQAANKNEFWVNF